ncbi:MAG: PHP domain-containing protein [Victivallales bacterium]|nr:PHP domain-containing protein [Victivallales bacterium]
MIDLHCHSTASDGTLSPTQLVQLALTIPLTALALTDHDTVNGLPEFLEASKQADALECIPGVEFSCQLESGDTCHIVGLYIDSKCGELQDACEQYCIWRKERNRQIVIKLNELGYDLAIEDLENAKKEEAGVIGRPHIAAALVAKGYFKQNKKAFQELLGRGRPAYVSRQVLPAARCLNAIHAAGGLAVWAHPMASNSMTYSKCERHIVELKASGLDGIEAYYTEHSQLQTKNIIGIAEKTGLFVSGGADFHGSNQPSIHMGTGYGGMSIPDSLMPPIKAAYERRGGSAKCLVNL